MTKTNRQTLHDAIARNAGIVLSLPSPAGLRHFKSRFLGEADGGFWADATHATSGEVEKLIASGQVCGVSFKSNLLKVVFATPVLVYNPRFCFNSQASLPAVLMRMPEELKAVQRRGSYRVRVPASEELTARVWRMAIVGELRDEPMAVQEVLTDLLDISHGGIGVIFRGIEGQPPKISMQDRLRVELRYGETVLLIEGRMRRPTQTMQQGALRTGVQFVSLHHDIEGRQKLAQLTRIVGELHRAEVRRCRLGIA
jgi:c-di-GMP-binding flagellar brake protein YcgR